MASKSGVGGNRGDRVAGSGSGNRSLLDNSAGESQSWLF